MIIDFEKVFVGEETVKFLLPTLLRHFPSLEFLKLVGGYLPRMEHLPAPEKLKKLEVIPTDEGLEDVANSQVEPVVINLSGLKSISIQNYWTYAEYEPLQINTFTRFTGVRLIESLVTHSARIQELKIDNFTELTEALLCCPAVVGSLRTLHLTVLQAEFKDVELDDQLSQLVGRLPDGHIPNLSKLVIENVHSELYLNELFLLTPNIEELTIKLIPSRFNWCKVKHPLHSLRRITVNKDVRPVWLESLRLKASPTGLEVTTSKSCK